MEEIEISPALAARLRADADRYECAAFVAGDPSRFPHALEGPLATPRNIEATAFVASSLSFGSIGQFVRKIAVLADAARGDMDGWIRRGAFENLPAGAPGDPFYRFVTFANLRAFLETYSALVVRHGSLGEYVAARAGGTGPGAVKAICAAFAGKGCGYLVPRDAKSACKRICMFLRWMVRSGSPVDFGLWSGFIDRRTLAMPLDVHVLSEARRLGLARGTNASMSAALKLSAAMARVFPDDPLRGDFALYGAGLARSRGD